jgi:hypothetical protein
MSGREAARIALDLDRLQSALRRGALSDLPEIAASLEAELDGTGDLDAGALEAVRQKALRNAACLEAAARGVRAARRRLAEIRSMDAGFLSYDPAGRRDEAGAAPAVLAQRL